MAISTIIFDLGNVLVESSPELAARRFSKLDGKPFEENMAIMQDNPDYMSGRISPAVFAKRHIKALNIPATEQEFHRIYTDIFSLNARMFDLLKKLKGRYKLVLLSNVEKPTAAFLEKKFPGLFTMFDHRIYSFEAGAVKPEKKIFLQALKQTGAKPEETIFVDDRQENVEAAQALGMHGIKYSSIETLKMELERILTDNYY